MASWQRILIAIDEENTSVKALRYVGSIIQHLTDYSVCLLHVYPSPPPDFFVNGGTFDQYRNTEERHSREIVARAAALLCEYGVPIERMQERIVMAEDCSISEAVLAVQREGDFGTVVVGKRGVSKAEEFLFGSISNSLARHSRDFCAWIVG